MTSHENPESPRGEEGHSPRGTQPAGGLGRAVCGLWAPGISAPPLSVFPPLLHQGTEWLNTAFLQAQWLSFQL